MLDGDTRNVPRETEPVGSRAPEFTDTERMLRLISERVLLSALREQDAAAAAQVARDRAEFLAEASLRFGASLDQELTYDAIAGVALPGLDAWCIVDIVEVSGAVRRLAVVHPDKDKQDMASTLARRWAPAANDLIGVPAVRDALVPVIISGHANAMVATAGRDPDTLRILRGLGAGSLLVVPIVAHHVLLGAITFVRRPGAPGYAQDDVLLAEALATRCAQALESARLYAAARAARVDADAARAQAEEANASKAHFLSTMSHELRTPLNAIGGYAQLMEMAIHGPVTDDQLRDLASIRRCQVHLGGLVNSVLDYAQIEAGQAIYHTEDVALSEILTSAQALVAPQAQEKGMHFVIVPCAPSPMVRADAAKVGQILVNLLANAIKFTPDGGQITLTCLPAVHGRAAMSTVTVTDTGLGIPADKIDKVFDPFFQVDRNLSSSSVGVGLGLAISRDLARGMGGELTMEPAAGGGSTFTLSLPSANA